MCVWTDKYIIGLTGNISTGKSAVRRMLEHLGAFGIDADALAHRAMIKGSPGYQKIISRFGNNILNANGYIDRFRLAEVVFSDAESLSDLETIIHPLVEIAVKNIIKKAQQKVIIIEAIKILESNLKNVCDSIWVTSTPSNKQLSRLINNRNMSIEDAQLRIQSQSTQSEKISRANVVINNHSTFTDTWKQVISAWDKIFTENKTCQKPLIPIDIPDGELTVIDGNPFLIPVMIKYFNQHSDSYGKIFEEDLMSQFTRHFFSLLFQNKKLVNVVACQVKNFCVYFSKFNIDAAIQNIEVFKLIEKQVIDKSINMLCESSMIVIPPEETRLINTFLELGYDTPHINSLERQEWIEIAREIIEPGGTLFFKRINDQYNFFEI